MFCPQCEAEYREGFDRCSDCGVDLVPELPEVDQEVDHNLHEHVTVLETSRPDMIPVIKSLFRGAGISFVTEGELMTNLFPSEALGTMFDPTAKVKFKVPVERSEEARKLLDTYSEDFAAPPAKGDEGEA